MHEISALHDEFQLDPCTNKHTKIKKVKDLQSTQNETLSLEVTRIPHGLCTSPCQKTTSYR